MKQKLVDFLRRYFTCRVLGHDWRVGHWGDARERHWDFRTWTCQECGECRRTKTIMNDNINGGEMILSPWRKRS